MVSTLVGTKGLCHVYLMPCDRSISLAPCRRNSRRTESSYIDRLPFYLLFILYMALAAGQSIAAETGAPSTALTQALSQISSERMLADIRALSGPAFNLTTLLPRGSCGNDSWSYNSIAHRAPSLPPRPIDSPRTPRFSPPPSA